MKSANETPNKTGTNHYKKGTLSDRDLRGVPKGKTLLVTPLPLKFSQYSEL